MTLCIRPSCAASRSCKPVPERNLLSVPLMAHNFLTSPAKECEGMPPADSLSHSFLMLNATACAASHRWWWEPFPID